MHALPVSHYDTTFVAAQGIEKSCLVRWRVSSTSNRMGAWLEANGVGEEGGGEQALILAWSFETGADGGLHP